MIMFALPEKQKAVMWTRNVEGCSRHEKHDGMEIDGVMIRNVNRFQAWQKEAITHIANAKVEERRDYNTVGFHVKGSDAACMYLKSVPIFEGKVINELKDTNSR